MMAEIDVMRDWLARLGADLDDQARVAEFLGDYYAGRHRLAYAGQKFRQVFGGLFEAFSDNWCDLVVDAVEERLNVSGFRSSASTQGDADVWAIWQRCGLDVESELAHTEALITGASYALVAPDPAGGGARITVEHPSQVIVAHAPGDRRRRLAALKRWKDDDDHLRATLYLPDLVARFISADRYKGDWVDTARVLWDPLEDGARVPNPLGVVPVVPLPNRPRMLGGGQSEIARVIPVQNAINKLVADMLVSAEYGAFPQRYAVGFQPDRDPTTGAAINPFVPGPGNVWTTQDPNVRMGEFGQAQLTSFVAAIELLVQHVASQTRTPPHYFYLSGNFPSGESIKSAETGLVAKTRRKMRHFGEGWEEVMRLAARLEGRADLAADTALETVWADPESRTESEHVDAILKKLALSVPVQQLWEDLGYSPQQVARFKVMQAGAALTAALATPAIAAAGGAPPPSAAPAEEPVTVRVSAAAALIRSGFEPEASLRAVGLDPIRHSGLLPVTVRAEEP